MKKKILQTKKKETNKNQQKFFIPHNFFHLVFENPNLFHKVCRRSCDVCLSYFPTRFL